jgi:hypothetical protein
MNNLAGLINKTWDQSELGAYCCYRPLEKKVFITVDVIHYGSLGGLTCKEVDLVRT